MDADLVRKIVIDAPAAVVFEYFTDPKKMQAWHARSAIVDGDRRFRIDVNGRSVAVGEFVVVEPPRRVIFTWGWDGAGQRMPSGSTTVEVTLREVDGKTEVTLVHRGIPTSELDQNSAGWDHYLPRLRLSIEAGEAGPDTWASAG